MPKDATYLEQGISIFQRLKSCALKGFLSEMQKKSTEHNAFSWLPLFLAGCGAHTYAKKTTKKSNKAYKIP